MSKVFEEVSAPAPKYWIEIFSLYKSPKPTWEFIVSIIPNLYTASSAVPNQVYPSGT